MDRNLWEGTLDLVDADGGLVARGAARIEALLNPADTWRGRILSEHPALELPHRTYTLRCDEPGWTALVEPVACSPTGDGHGTAIEFRGVTAWPVAMKPA
ncbi:MAG: hypothetical protein IT303_04685 [Dehalococcoidia bacterium]|nr:hypothetical protein [Dehalococcoidia bacterium]